MIDVKIAEIMFKEERERMALDICFYGDPEVVTPQVRGFNITHNLCPMAKEVGLYEPLWRGRENHIESAEKLLPYLLRGKKIMENNKEKLIKFNPENYWGSYEAFLRVIDEMIECCKTTPTAIFKSNG